MFAKNVKAYIFQYTVLVHLLSLLQYDAKSCKFLFEIVKFVRSALKRSSKVVHLLSCQTRSTITLTHSAITTTNACKQHRWSYAAREVQKQAQAGYGEPTFVHVMMMMLIGSWHSSATKSETNIINGEGLWCRDPWSRFTGCSRICVCAWESSKGLRRMVHDSIASIKPVGFSQTPLCTSYEFLKES